MLDYDAFGEDTAWQDVYRSLQKLMEHLHIAVLNGKPGHLGGSKRMLDAQIAQAKFLLHGITAQLARLDGAETETQWFETTHLLGQLYAPWLSGTPFMTLHKQNLTAYAELLQAYIVLLEKARGSETESESSSSKREHYKVV